jgi:hypothetical protein
MDVDDARTLIPALISRLGNLLRELGEIGIGFFPMKPPSGSYGEDQFFSGPKFPHLSQPPLGVPTIFLRAGPKEKKRGQIVWPNAQFSISVAVPIF